MKSIIELRDQAVSGVLLERAYDSVGVYPKSFVGKYEKRTERMEGWNEALTAILNRWSKFESWLESVDENTSSTIKDLLLEEKIYLHLRDDEVKMSILCNDVFSWGCADSEWIAVDELPDLVECLALNYECGDILWVCRKSKIRPQGAYYSYIPKELWSEFDACGPEREKGPGNPCAPGEYK